MSPLQYFGNKSYALHRFLYLIFLDICKEGEMYNISEKRGEIHTFDV